MQPLLAIEPPISRLRLADRPPDTKLFGIANRVARSLGVFAALVTLVDETKQTFLAHSGLPADLARANGTPASWSFCQHTVRQQKALIVPDAREDARFSASPLTTTSLVRSYAGVPIILEGVGAVGAVCVIHDEPRAFNEADVTVLDLAAQVVAAHLATERARKGSPAASVRTEVGAVPEVGTFLDRKYWITATLGRGGQGDVFLGRDGLTGQLVAIKIMQRSPRSDDVLLHEARALARVRHPNLVALHGWGHTEQGQMYVVLDYVEGEHLVTSRPPGATEAMATVLKTGRELAGALATMHAMGLIHGDVKPTNVLLDRQLDRAVLIDLGIGVFFEKSGTFSAGGTLGYSAPEQFCGGELTPAVDVYALAATLYAQLTGRGPFQHHAESRVLGAQLGGRFAPLSDVRPDLPDAASAVFARALSPNPLARPASVLELVNALGRAFAQHSSDRLSLAFAVKARTSGRVFRLWRQEVRSQIGAQREEGVVARLPESARTVVTAIKSDDGWYDADALLSYAYAATGGDAAPIEAIGEGVMVRTLPDMLTLLNVTRTTPTLVRVIPDLVRKLVDWLDVGVSVLDDSTVRLEMRMPPAFAAVMCSFLRGAIRGVVSFLGLDVEVGEPACCRRGAQTCEFVVRSLTPIALT